MTLVPKQAAEDLRTQTAGQRMVDETRCELARAEAPVEVNRARLRAEALTKVLESAVKSGATHLVEAHREAQLLSLEAGLALGERVLPATFRPAEPDGQAVGTKIEAKAVTEVAKTSGAPRRTVRRLAELAVARRVRPDDFDKLVIDALDDGKPIPLQKLRALAKGPPKAKRATSLGKQIAIRLDERDYRALKDAVGVDQATGKAKPLADWVRDLVIDAVSFERPVCARRLVERAVAELHAAGKKHERVAGRLEALAKELAT